LAEVTKTQQQHPESCAAKNNQLTESSELQVQTFSTFRRRTGLQVLLSAASRSVLRQFYRSAFGRTRRIIEDDRWSVERRA